MQTLTFTDDRGKHATLRKVSGSKEDMFLLMDAINATDGYHGPHMNTYKDIDSQPDLVAMVEEQAKREVGG